jgi:cytosine/adenosine deaminase-related metal-dependent hydrolase
MRKISADWIFPISSPPIFKGVIIVASDGTILEVLDPDKVEVSVSDVEYYDGILCPGFVNTHCHLELSYLQGRMNRHTGLDGFIRSLVTLYREESPSQNKEQLFSLENADHEMSENGIIAVGDIVSFIPSEEHSSVKENSPLYYHSFAEVFGSRPEDATAQLGKGIDTLVKLRSLERNPYSSLSPHSTYSLSPGLFSLAKNFIELEGKPTTIHHLENNDEVLFYHDGSGPVLERMNAMNINLTHEPLRGERPLLALQGHLPREVPILLVHNTVAGPEDIVIAEELFNSAWWCLCPNANLFIENRLPDLRTFSEVYHRITLGTDSLVSNENLSILEEMKTLQKAFPDLELDSAIRWGTLNGAEFLGISDWAGSLSKGRNPGINLIEWLDTEKLLLLKESRVKVITSCHPF